MAEANQRLVLEVNCAISWKNSALHNYNYNIIQCTTGLIKL